MGAICLDDAWQACSLSEMEVWDTKQLATKATAEAETAAFATRPPPERERGRGSKEKSDRAHQRLCAELSRLRQQLSERDRAQSVVLHVALAVVVILLVVVLQSSWKLQHATECVLWYSRK